MRIPPVEVILSWPTPNYLDPPTRGEALLVLMVLFSALVLIAVLGRFYSRVIVKKGFGWDDSMIVLALIFSLAMNITVILANRKYGWNRHLWDVDPTDYSNAGIIAFTAKLLFVEAATFTRMSLHCFYYRLVRDSGIGWFRYVLHASMLFIVLLGIASICIGIWLCVPVQSYWVFPPMEDAKCLDEGVVTLVIGVLNCFADLLTTLLPIPLVMKLQMPLKQRIGVCILLSLGIVVTVAGVVRTYYVWVALIKSWDETWFSYPLWICAAIEIDVAVICACAPALKHILHQPLSRLSSQISAGISSLHSSVRGGTTVPRPTHSSNATNRSVRPFRKKSGDSLWDAHEEYKTLKRMEAKQQQMTATTVSCHVSPSAEHEIHELPPPPPQRPDAPKRTPTLEIIKMQSVDQEISYLTPERSHASASGSGSPPQTGRYYVAARADLGGSGTNYHAVETGQSIQNFPDPTKNKFDGLFSQPLYRN
ncbi:unnamed protein product [Lecanosticta acicola]|uniref:Unnamed protein product n=1 Tax=Lecanosticta acicola TaxID=111012 RepID=A0AAI8YUR8_9PEZI|nr:unnamed protein product [Lecanosticta acicola]